MSGKAHRRSGSSVVSPRGRERNSSVASTLPNLASISHREQSETYLLTIKNLEAELAASKQENTKLKGNVASMESLLSRMTSTEKSQTSLIGELKSQIKHLTSNASLLKDKLDLEKAKIAKFENKLADKSKECEHISDVNDLNIHRYKLAVYRAWHALSVGAKYKEQFFKLNRETSKELEELRYSSKTYKKKLDKSLAQVSESKLSVVQLSFILKFTLIGNFAKLYRVRKYYKSISSNLEKLRKQVHEMNCYQEGYLHPSQEPAPSTTLGMIKNSNSFRQGKITDKMGELERMVVELRHDTMSLLERMKSNTTKFFRRNIEMKAKLTASEESVNARVEGILKQLEEEKARTANLNEAIQELLEENENYEEQAEQHVRERVVLRRIQDEQTKVLSDLFISYIIQGLLGLPCLLECNIIYVCIYVYIYTGPAVSQCPVGCSEPESTLSLRRIPPVLRPICREGETRPSNRICS